MKNKNKFRVISNSIVHCGIVQLTITYTILAILAKTNGEIINYASRRPELHVDTINIKSNSQQLPVSIDNVNNNRNNFQINKEERMADFVFSNSTNNQENTKYKIKVEPIYNFERKKIVFNVTWSKPKDVNILSYKFKLSTNCTYHFFETRIYQKSDLTNIYIPPILNSEEVLPGCGYNLTTTIDTSDFKTDIIIINHQVPECVGQKCSCKLLTPKFESFAAYEIQPGTLNITWKIMKNTNRSVNQITNKMFEYRLLNISRKHANPFKKIYSISSNIADNNDYIILNDTRFLVHDKQYELRANFNNSFNCKAYNYTNITVTKFHIIHEASKKNSWTIWVISISLIFFMLVAGAYFFKRNRLILKELILNPSSVNIFRRQRRELDIRNSYFMVPTIIKRREEINVIYVDKEIIDGNVDRYEFPRSGLHLIKEIGSGAFGKVFSATVLDINNQPGYTDAAVKTLNESASPEEMDDFLSEIEILKKIGQHPNIVQLLGCCILKKPYFMIMEYMPCGDLLHYLINLRETWHRIKNYSSSVFSDISDGAYIVPDNPMCTIKPGDRPSLTETEYTTIESEGTPSPTRLQNNSIECSLSHTELQQFALQIAKGMEHLEKIPITHRDLAARNILIDEYKNLKISDFGLSRSGPYVNNRTQKLPLRWISLEAIKDHFYDSKGDVWSFGVVLWEIGTLGGFPYEGVSNSMVPGYLAYGNRLPRPEICTNELYSLMLKCWTYEPQERPSFKELVEMLDVKKTRVYVDFSQLNPLYVFPPSKCNEQKCTLTENTSVV